MITKQLVNSLFEYSNGKLFWKDCGRKTNLIGKEAGTIDAGRRQIVINKKHYKTHRLVYLMFYGYMPKEVDHIDGNPLNNDITNLRQADRSEQNCNTKLRVNSKTGIKGVSWDTNRNKWIVVVNKNKQTVYRNRFDDIELAELVAIEARDKFHKHFARHQ